MGRLSFVSPFVFLSNFRRYLNAEKIEHYSAVCDPTKNCMQMKHWNLL